MNLFTSKICKTNLPGAGNIVVGEKFSYTGSHYTGLTIQGLIIQGLIIQGLSLYRVSLYRVSHVPSKKIVQFEMTLGRSPLTFFA